MLAKFVALAAGLAATAAAADACHGNYFSFYNRGGNAMSYQRVDPILQPGIVSPHLHSFDGSNSVSASTDFAATQSSTCTTARIKPDKSLYWRPTLYFNGDNGNGTGFHRVPEGQTKIYYKFGDGNEWANVTGFPEGFNMIAGYPNKRSDGDNPAGVRWACHKPNDGLIDDIYTPGFPSGFHNCSGGFATEVTYPSCWNGNFLDPKKPYDHMAYPTNTGVGLENCPTTHRAARFPTIFIEYWYDISSFSGTFPEDSVPWVLSNGDPTGYSFHADFLNGWEKGVLEKAIAETGGCNCGCGCGQTEIEQCFGAANVNVDNNPEWAQCSMPDTSAPSEAAAFLETLPGCNPLQYGPADATPVTGAGCAATAIAVGGGNKSSSATTGATKTPAVSSPAASPTGEAVQSNSSPLPSLSLSLANKGMDNVPAATPAAASSQQYGAAEPTPNDVLPSLALASPTPSAASQPATPAGSGAEGGDEECKAPVYVTVTPTIYVTAGSVPMGSNATSCDLGTVTKTATEITTVTVSAAAGIQYGSY